MSSKPIMPSGEVRRTRVGRTEITLGHDGLAIVAPGARNLVWIPAAVGYGVPWLTAVLVVSVWYLGWGIPDGFLVRVLLWLVTMVLLGAMHALAVLAIWAAIYARTGVETLVIDPRHITVIRRAGRFPIRLHIKRTIVERAYLLPERQGRMAHPRVEVKAWRSAIRFGAGLDESEAAECIAAINAQFEQDEWARHALTPDDAGATIAPTRPEGREHQAMTGTSRNTIGLSKRAGTVRARGARWFRKSPPSFGPNGRRAK